MKIRPIISALSIASLSIFGVSCKTTGNAGGSSDDGAYVGTGSGEYDNVYEMGGGDDDPYSSEPADDSGSSYNYESNDYSSSPAPAPTQPTYTPAPTQPTYTPAPTQPAYTPAPANNRRHTVQRGDTLYNLSKRYGTTVGAIQSANGLTGDLIRIDQTLMIP
ncbi:MAG: lipoprotein NlpD [Verrucomicrobiales bacterium]|jgi:lipoprotein NlpD